MIDAHMHFWRVARGDYGWLTPDLGALYRDFLPSGAAPMLDGAGVTGVVAVQAAETEAETRFLFDLARQHPAIRGVVGWTDFAAADAADRIRCLAADGAGRLVGLRPMLQDMADRDWIARPELDAAFGALIELGLAFDALVRPDNLPGVARRLERSPRLRLIVDHLAKPDMEAGDFESWQAGIRSIAAHPDTFCKLSGLFTEPGGATVASERYVAAAFEAFGPERMMWGGDWPVLLLAGRYDEWLTGARDMVARHAPDHAHDVFGRTAARAYRLAEAATDRLLILSDRDNVGVAIAGIAAGATLAGGVVAAAAVPMGFKVAVRDIPAGSKVVKYGVSIGSATRTIRPGEVVHLHNMRSDYTETHTRDLREQA